MQRSRECPEGCEELLGLQGRSWRLPGLLGRGLGRCCSPNALLHLRSNASEPTFPNISPTHPFAPHDAALRKSLKKKDCAKRQIPPSQVFRGFLYDSSDFLPPFVAETGVLLVYEQCNPLLALSLLPRASSLCVQCLDVPSSCALQGTHSNARRLANESHGGTQGQDLSDIAAIPPEPLCPICSPGMENRN